MAKKILRWLITLVGAVAGYGVGILIKGALAIDFAKPLYEILFYAFFVGVFAIIFYSLFGVFVKQTKNIADVIEHDIRKLSSVDLFLGIIGLIVGLLLSYLIVLLIDRLNFIPYISGALSILTYLLIVSISVTVFTRRKEDFLNTFRVLRPRREEERPLLAETESGGVPKFVDTSVIIDGRFLDVMNTGFVEGMIYIPSFVLEELQHIADSDDPLKRQRGRRGLDILNRMKKTYPNRIVILTAKKARDAQVDIALLDITEAHHGVVVTNDYNLNKVADVRNIEVLNINDLSQALKPVVLPGETMTIDISQMGKEQGQGVGYLNDGTMIVVENGKKHIGKTKDVVVTSVLQTSAGRMIFARLKD
ncbi:MAG: TRAM domain-containing protein [Tissierellia bacterium]|nr:TRAM domain-containing protein [Tissierellia bacterium]